jgi:hypothetical protein
MVRGFKMKIIHSYTRAEAITDGLQFNCKLAKEAGFNFPVYITNGINNLIKKSLSYGCNDYNGVMWDILMVLLSTVKYNKNSDIINFSVLIYWDSGKLKPFNIIA